MSRGKGRGVRIDFDEDDGPITGELSLIDVLCWPIRLRGFRAGI